MNSANAFSYAISGSFTEEQVNNYGNYVQRNVDMFKNIGGWLGEQANKTMDSFNQFLSSKAWEMSKRILGKTDGEYVSRYEIGYLGSVESLQGAEGFMRDIIMAHPGMMQLYLDEQIEGFGGDFSQWCTGVGVDNLYYRRMWNGVVNLSHVDEQAVVSRTHFNDSVGGKLSFRERVDAHKTHRAIDHHLAATLFDLSSPAGAKRKALEEAAKPEKE